MGAQSGDRMDHPKSNQGDRVKKTVGVTYFIIPVDPRRRHFRVVLLPFLCQRDIREYFDSGEGKIVLFRLFYLKLSVPSPYVQDCVQLYPMESSRSFVY
jgi:hypothetical protein